MAYQENEIIYNFEDAVSAYGFSNFTAACDIYRIETGELTIVGERWKEGIIWPDRIFEIMHERFRERNKT